MFLPKLTVLREKSKWGVYHQETGINVTMIVAVNAIVKYVLPMLIFPSVHFKNHTLTGGPRASIGGTNPTGWSNERIFVDYLKHFIACKRACKEHTVLLVLDNHKSHLSIPALNVAKENDNFFLTLSPHTSFKLQPLDCTVFGPYKTYYNACLNNWMLSNQDKTVPIYNVAGITGKSFSKEFTKHNTEMGFNVTGIIP